jgi:AcrR family transcriptional regulator
MAAKKDTYHHGALREALLVAAERIVREKGVAALTLRAAARAAAVSHAAPAHHFKDLSGLLTALAINGFRRLRDGIAQAATDARRKPWYVGRAYVSFAMENPGLFLLMFRSESLNGRNLELQQERAAAFAALAQARGVGADPSLAQLGALAASWSLVHGFALLYIDGRLKRLLAAAPAGTQPLELLDAAFASIGPAAAATPHS